MEGGTHSPFPPSSPGSDLASKYTKLASEYSKLRAQSGVLKKAVLDEQGKISELSEALRQRDQILRKSEAEMESVNFRNQQLSKRVEILQMEMEKNRIRETSGKKGSRDHLHNQELVIASENLNSVFGEELQLKIEENERLHQRLNEIDKNHEEKVDSLQSRIRELESRLSKIEQADRAEDTKQKELIQGLKVDNVDLQSKIQELQKELADRNDRITVLQVQLESTEIGANLRENYSPQRYSAPALNSNYMLLNSTEARIQTVELMSSVGESIQEFVAALSDWHTYWEHRLKDTRSSDGKWSCESAGILSKILLQNVKHLKPIEEAYQKILSEILNPKSANFGQKTRLKFSSFFEKYSSYVEYAVHQVEPLVISCLQHENNSPLCSPTQQAKNVQFQSCLREFDQLLVQLAEKLSDLVKDEEPADNSVDAIVLTVSKLHHQSAELARIYSAKALDENSLPTISRQLIGTNDCIIASLSNLSGALNNLSSKLSDNLLRMSNLVYTTFEEEKPDGHVTENDSAEKCVVDHSAFEEIESQRISKLEESIGNLKHEIESLNEKLKKAEQAKEHWKLECQLLQMKHEKLREQSPQPDLANSSFPEETPIGDEMKQMFTARLDNLVSEKLLADSKAAHFYLECVALQKRLKGREKAKLKAEEELMIAEEQVRILRDEMGLTTSNYEGQLSLMSEHVASINDKIASQTDQIERLKYELAQKNNGKKK